MKFASVFTDHAVFQRSIPVPVWGNEASPSHLLQAELAGAKTFTRVAADGGFFFRFTPFLAGGPYELIIRDLDDGTTLKLSDIMIGEVWLAGGQSNMEYHLNSDWSAKKDLPEEERVNEVNRTQFREYLDTLPGNGMIRAFSVPLLSPGSRESSVKASWTVVDKKTAGDVSAVAAWFAKNVQEKLNVPVGLLVSDWGGTIAEAWTSRSGLLSNPVTAEYPRLADAGMGIRENWCGDTMTFEQLTIQDPGNKGFEMGWANTGFNDSPWRDYSVPGSWMVQNIAGNGALWARLRVQIPESWAGKDLTINLGGIDKMDTTYFDGTEVGKTGSGWDTEFWNVKRKYTVPGKLVKPGPCVIAVRAYSFIYDSSMNGNAEDYSLCLNGTDEKISLAGTWRAKAELDLGVIETSGSRIRWTTVNPNAPSILFDSMIRPLLPYAIRGAIWYQGESNAGSSPAVAKTYRSKLDTMIRDWRYHWEEGDFPFIQVQLANWLTPKSYDKRSTWASLREAQMLCCKDLPNVFMASAIDIGDEIDIHPQNKKEVGYRLAQSAFHNVYRMSDVVPSGPLYSEAVFEGSQVRIRFAYKDGLHFKGSPKGFFVAGISGEFMAADKVEIKDDEVVLSSANVAIPLYVRYSWADNPDGNLYNAANLPASPFRTDDLPL